jgi:uncharacterized membrane protein
VVLAAAVKRDRHTDPAARRAAEGAGAAAAVGALSLLEGGSWSVTALAAWGGAALVFLASVWLTIATADSASTARMARSEDSRPAAEAMLVGAGVTSLVGVAFTLAQAGAASGPSRGLLTALAVGSVVLAWASVHTVYLLRYARLFHSEPTGGIDFHGEAPDYLDFAYLALTIGMTFQVSDTSLTAKRIRRAAIHHALLSYLFGTVIVAVTVNIVAKLLGS